MKASWKGSLTFGLVTINVELYPAIEQHKIGFKLLHAKCHTPISYHRWCSRCKKEVAWQEIEKGIKLDDGTFFIITKENLKKLKPQKTDAISIVEFVDNDVIDPILLDEHYYVLPSLKTPYQSFFLFACALENVGKIAIGQFVLRDKEYVCTIRPYKDVLLLTTLNYGYEVRDLPKMTKVKTKKIAPQELKLAEQLIKKLSKKTFDITKFKDTFVENLKKKIRDAKKEIVSKKGTRKIGKKVNEKASLLKVLEASLKSKRVNQPTARA